MTKITKEFDARVWAEISHALSTHAVELISAESRRTGGRSVTNPRVMQVQAIQDSIDESIRDQQRSPEIIR